MAESVCIVLTSMIVPSMTFLPSFSAFTRTKDVTLSIEGKFGPNKDW